MSTARRSSVKRSYGAVDQLSTSYPSEGSHNAPQASSFGSTHHIMADGARQVTVEEAAPLLGDVAFFDGDGEGDLSSAQQNHPSSRKPKSPRTGDAVASNFSDSPNETVRVDFEDRDNDHAISNCDTIIHLLKGNVGTGILAMPDAIKNSGLWVGSVSLVFLSVFCVSCMHMLVGCAHKLCAKTGKSFMTYADVAESAFSTSRHASVRRLSKVARKMVIVFLCITQLGFCCVYFVFVSQNIKKVFDHHFRALDYRIYMVITLIPMLLVCSIRNLKYLSPISMLANFLQMGGLGLIFFYLFKDLPVTWDRKAFATWGQLPLYFGTAIYAFEGIGVVLPLENQMREPASMRGWNGVLNTAMVIVTCLYIAVGFFGYLKYGESVEGSITLNLPPDQWLAQIIIIMMSLAIFFTYCLQFYVPLELILPSFQEMLDERYHLIGDFFLRYMLVLLTFGLAACIPKLDLFISLVGAVSSSTLALMAPTVIHSITYWDELKGFTGALSIGRNIFLFIIGFVGFLTGTFVSVQNIIAYFAGNGD